MEWVILIVILTTTILDAFRDRWIPKVCRGEDWLLWHLVKWGAFFLPLILLSYFWLEHYRFRTSNIIIFIVFAIVCNVVWSFVYQYKNEFPKKKLRSP